jgi:hypothetical protein
MMQPNGRADLNPRGASAPLVGSKAKALRGLKPAVLCGYRIFAIFALAAAGSLPIAAQRLDGCTTFQSPDVHLPIQAVSRETREHGLKDAGYTLAGDSLVSALSDPRADVRGAAAQSIAEQVVGRTLLAPVLRAWLAEKDACSAGAMLNALSQLMHGVAWDPTQHPGDQQLVTPFQSCTPSGRQVMSATIEQTRDQYYSGPAIRLTYRNQTAQTLAFAKTPAPMDLFSVTVLNPAGERAKVTQGREWLYEPLQLQHAPTRPGDSITVLTNSFRLVFAPLRPGEDVSWIWRIGEGFDLSEPGTYRVSFGGRIDYLDTTVCSNTALVTVDK